jgi:hypothetical protein
MCAQPLQEYGAHIRISWVQHLCAHLYFSKDERAPVPLQALASCSQWSNKLVEGGDLGRIGVEKNETHIQAHIQI